MQAFIYHLTMMRSKRYIQKTYGKSFWKQFQALSDPVFHQVSKELPDIGDSFFIQLCLCTVLCGMEGMLPGICSVDFMISHYMGNGFSRTKTLGAGDECCNCHYELQGTCPLHAPKGMNSNDTMGLPYTGCLSRFADVQ